MIQTVFGGKQSTDILIASESVNTRWVRSTRCSLGSVLLRRRNLDRISIKTQPFSFAQYRHRGSVDGFKNERTRKALKPLDPDDKRIDGSVPLWLMRRITIYHWIRLFLTRYEWEHSSFLWCLIYADKAFGTGSFSSHFFFTQLSLTSQTLTLALADSL